MVTGFAGPVQPPRAPAKFKVVVPVQVLHWSEDVLSWLHNLLQEGKSAAEPPPHCQLLECFAAWVRLGCLFRTDLPQGAAEALLGFTFSGIHSSDPGRRRGLLQLKLGSKDGHSMSRLLDTTTKEMWGCYRRGGGCYHSGCGYCGAMPRRAPPVSISSHGLPVRGSSRGTHALSFRLLANNTGMRHTNIEILVMSGCRQQKGGMQTMLEGSVMPFPPIAAATCSCGPLPLPR